MSRLAWEAVVFDLDGTLIDTEPYYRAAFHAAAHSFGVTVPADLYASVVGIATRERRPMLQRAFGDRFPVDDFIDEYYTQRAEHLPTRIPLCAGAASLLRRLRLPKAIATSASRGTALCHMERAGLHGDFTHVVTRDDVARGKPAPDAFLRAAELLQVERSQCLAVEDSIIGALAAHRAGMSVVVIGSSPAAEVRQCCIASVPTLDALHDMLGSCAALAEPCSSFARSVRGGAEEDPMARGT